MNDVNDWYFHDTFATFNRIALINDFYSAEHDILCF